MISQRCGHTSTEFWRWLDSRACQFSRDGLAETAFSKTGSYQASVTLFLMLFSSWQVVFAQSTQNPEYTTAKQAAQSNWTNPPLSANAGKDVVGVLTRDANELNAAKALYKTAPPAVQGAVDGTLLGAGAAVKAYAESIVTAHHCELTPLPATADPLTRTASEITDTSICLGGQPAETLGHKIANNGNVRALERQLTFGFKGHGDKQAAINKRMDPQSAGAIDFAVQQIINSFSKNDIAAEIARERQASTQQPQGPSVPPSSRYLSPITPPPPPPSVSAIRIAGS